MMHTTSFPIENVSYCRTMESLVKSSWVRDELCWLKRSPQNTMSTKINAIKRKVGRRWVRADKCLKSSISREMWELHSFSFLVPIFFLLTEGRGDLCWTKNPPCYSFITFTQWTCVHICVKCRKQEEGKEGVGYSYTTIKTAHVFCFLHVFFPNYAWTSESHRKKHPSSRQWRRARWWVEGGG